MFNDLTYKISFIFALILHLALLSFLVVRFNHSRGANFVIAPGNVINAIAINERDLVRLKSLPKAEQPSKTKSAVESNQKEQLESVLKKDLLAERARELKELKKEQKKYKKIIAKQNEQIMKKMLQDEIVAEQKQLSANQSLSQSLGAEKGQIGKQIGEVNKYKALIKQAISLEWNKPKQALTEDYCELLINVAPGGVVLDMHLINSSGNELWDREAQAAITKASPLPVPEDLKLFNEFRTIKLIFRPQGIVGN